MGSSKSLALTLPLIAAMARLGNNASAEEVREKVIWEVLLHLLRLACCPGAYVGSYLVLIFTSDLY